MVLSIRAKESVSKALEGLCHKKIGFPYNGYAGHFCAGCYNPTEDSHCSDCFLFDCEEEDWDDDDDEYDDWDADEDDDDDEEDEDWKDGFLAVIQPYMISVERNFAGEDDEDEEDEDYYDYYRNDHIYQRAPGYSRAPTYPF